MARRREHRINETQSISLRSVRLAARVDGRDAVLCVQLRFSVAEAECRLPVRVGPGTRNYSGLSFCIGLSQLHCAVQKED